MWHLTKIKATNICAFEELEYSPLQAHATLIFGNNMDNDSQNSNGSGKSALIEAIAIGLTGETLRKVNMDEIINDRFETATIQLTLSNKELGTVLYIDRKLSRKQPQDVVVRKQTGPYDTDLESVCESSVADYNKYILSQIGLSKDDIFGNFILTARKYKSFLSSSDKEKKEIINRFSNGSLIDESIAILHEDIEPAEKSFREAEQMVAQANGSINAMQGEIERLVNETTQRQLERETKIARLNDEIAEMRSQIRANNENIEQYDNHLETLNSLDVKIQDIESGKSSFVDAYNAVVRSLKDCQAPPISDYQEKLMVNQKKIDSFAAQLKGAEENLANCILACATKEKELESAEEAKDKMGVEYDRQSSELSKRIQMLLAEFKEIEAKTDKLIETRNHQSSVLAEMQKKLASAITCPKCKYEFSLGNGEDIVAIKEKYNKLEEKYQTVLQQLKESQELGQKTQDKGREARRRECNIANARSELITGYNRVLAEASKAKKTVATAENTVASWNKQIESAQSELENLSKSMFDEAFRNIDADYEVTSAKIKNLEKRNADLEGHIEANKVSIERLKNSSDDNLLDNFKKSKAKYEKECRKAMQLKNERETVLNKLREQDKRFVEFKTYLANSKVLAISQITNEFLAAIGSDIQVSLSGYTILKSGKVRDKISVSVIRDGVDCGSFEKFSAGERVRLELASILAMRQLTNVNTEEGRGLDLLVCDEILDSSDEQGLANIFKALNSTGVTSLVVSHGNIAENYPNRLVVNKKNGVSFLNGTT